MFKVNDLPLEVKFKKTHQIHPRFKKERLCYECKVCFNSGAVNSYGMSWLNPTDSNNKILGKKIALQRAIMNFNKEQRTKIWKAFWQWVRK